MEATYTSVNNTNKPLQMNSFRPIAIGWNEYFSKKYVNAPPDLKRG